MNYRFVSTTPGKRGVVKCDGNYNKKTKCRVFKLPKNEHERQSWINALPPRKNFEIDPLKFLICERHWPKDIPKKTVPEGYTLPILPPSIFQNIPPSCLPTHKPEPRKPKEEDIQLNYFFQKRQNTVVY